jgi:Zn2+/Cd2+-exporting ATPase
MNKRSYIENGVSTMTLSYPLQQVFPSAEDCQECRGLLQGALQKLSGVRSVRLDSNEVSLEADRDLKNDVANIINNITQTHSHASFKIEGMDCASCAKTVEGALCRMPGVSDYKLNYMAEKLEVAYNPKEASHQDFATKIEPLGYKVRVLNGVGSSVASSKSKADDHDHAGHNHGDDHNHSDDHSHAKNEQASHADDHDHTEEHSQGVPWYRTRQGKPVVLSGILLVLAFMFSYIAPQFAQYGYIAATLIGGWQFAVKAYRGARVGNPWSINTLMSVAALGAILIGEGAEAAVVVFLFAVGELLEGVAAGRARAGIRSLAALAPKTAFLVHEESHDDERGVHTHEVAADSLKVGQFVLVQPGGRVPADGTIAEGQSALDDSPVTGESVPVNKKEGDSVYAGSINTDNVLKVRVDKAASDNTIARIINMVEEAQENKAPTERFIDRFSRYYTPGVMLVSLLVIVIPPLLFGGAWHEWIYKGLSLLLIGCPCALLISVPAAVTSALSAGARKGLLIKGGAALETIGSVKTIAFDKTGTLTEGKPKVTDVIAVGISETDLLAKAAAVERGSSHPLAEAIVDKAKAMKVVIPNSDNQKAVQGKAATATMDGREFAVGSPRYASERLPLSSDVQKQIETLEAQGKTVVVILEDKILLGLLAIRDEARADAKQALADLKHLGVQGVMLTGDNARTGKAIADGLGLEVQADLMPQDKLRIIGELKREGKVAMIGDGINDAPALAQADIGIAMGGGTDVALETADVALLRNSVSGVTDLVKLSRATMFNIKQNIAVALGLKVVFLITTLFGWTNLWMAILADTGATVLVTANALRLLSFKSVR